MAKRGAGRTGAEAQRELNQDNSHQRALDAMPWLAEVQRDLEGLGWTLYETAMNDGETDAWLRWRVPSLMLKRLGGNGLSDLIASQTQIDELTVDFLRAQAARDPDIADPRFLLLADDHPDLLGRLSAFPSWQGLVAVTPGRPEQVLAQLLRLLRPVDPFDVRAPVHAAELRGRDDDLLQLVGDIHTHPAIGLFGLRKMGKTSLAQALRARFTAHADPQRAGAWAFAYADAEKELLDGTKGLAEALTAQLHQPRKGQSQPGKGLAGLQREVEHLVGQKRPICLIIDEHDLLIAGDNAYAAGAVDLLRLLRALSQDPARLVRIVLVGRLPDRVNAPRLLGVPNPTLNYFRPHWVGPLRRAASDELLRHLGQAAGLRFDPSALDQAWELAAGHPLMTRLYGSALLKLVQAAHPDRLLDDIDTTPFADTARKQLLRGHDARNHFAEIQDLLTHTAPLALELLGELAGHPDPAARWAEADGELPAEADLLRHYGLVDGETGRVPGLLRHFLVPPPARQRAPAAR